MKLQGGHVKTVGNEYRDIARAMGVFADFGVCEMDLGEAKSKVIYQISTSQEAICIPQEAEKAEYHEPHGDGDRHYVDVYLKDGRIRRIFDITDIYFRA